MRAYVFTDRKLLKLAGRSVRLDIDTENPANGTFVERFPIDAWPTLLVIDPATEQVVVRWVGTATADDVVQLALDGEKAVKAERRSRADAALARADALMGERKHGEAAAAYAQALAEGGKRWPARERAAENRVQALSFVEDQAPCAAAAKELLPLVEDVNRRARILESGLSCALALDDQQAQLAAVAPLEPAARRLLKDRAVLANDRSGLYELLLGAQEARGDEAKVRALAGQWWAFLERETVRAPTALARSSYNSARVSAAVALGEPARALPALQASERELPGEFTPPASLAYLYLELGRPADARAAADRALALAQGPRRVRVLTLRARAERDLGELAAARASAAEAVKLGESYAPGQRPEGYLRAARKLAGELEASGAPAP
ncbi:MAG: hypothetical protein QM767_27785 [Anaeromyxobacter sp.]